MSNQTRQCPICRREVAPTREHNICGHMDKANTPCPGSYQIPYDLAIRTDNPPTPAELTALMAQIHQMTARRP